MYPSQEQQPSGAEPYSQERPYSSPSGAGSYPYPPQGPYVPPTEGNPYPYTQQQGPYMPPPGASPYPYSSQGPYAPPQPGPYPYPPQQGPYYAPPQYSVPVSNARANRAMIYGFISFALGAITLATNLGYAGLITGTFAIFYGFTGLNISKRLPNNSGRTQAIIGIVLGFLAWFVVILSLVIRNMNSPY